MRQASAYRTVRRRQSGTSVEIPVGTIRPKRKIRIVLEGLRGEVSIAELCRKEGINQSPKQGDCLRVRKYWARGKATWLPIGRAMP